MRTRSMVRARCEAAATLLGITVFAAGRAFADPIPPAHFTFDVYHGRMVLADCTPWWGTTLGGTCGSEGSAPGYAATSGGIGTPSYLPVTPGGTVLGTGTAVDAMSIGTSQGWVHSNAAMTYSFEATGPAGDSLIPIDVLSTGLISASGDAGAFLSLVISGPKGGDPLEPGADWKWNKSLLDLSAFCLRDSCFSDWGTPGHQLTDPLCVVNGDIYTITIDAQTGAGPRWRGENSASAVLDPRLILDPPSVPGCPLMGSLSEYTLETGPGASTGYAVAAVPEPSMISLAAIGALGWGWLGFGWRRQSRPRARA
jgi:hypothetical protein